MSLTGPTNPVSREAPVSQPLILADNPELQSSLKENQKLTVQVVAVSGDKVLLNIGGKGVFAKTTVPLQVGATLTVEVRQVQQFPITLSLISSQVPLTPVTAEASLADIIAMMGVRNTDSARGLVKELLEAGVPLEDGRLREALSLVSSMENEPDALKGIVFMMQHELPINSGVLKRVVSFLSARELEGNENPIGTLTKTIRDFLGELTKLQLQGEESLITPGVEEGLTLLNEEKKSIPAGGDLHGRLVISDVFKFKEELQNFLRQLTINTEVEPQSLAPQVAKIIQEATTGVEAKLLAVAKSETNFFMFMEEALEKGNLPQELQNALRTLEEEIAVLLKNGGQLPDLQSYITNRLENLDKAGKTFFRQFVEQNPGLHNLLKQAVELTSLHRDLAVTANELRPILTFLHAKLNETLQTNLLPHLPSSLGQLSNAMQEAMLHAEGEQLVNLGLSNHPEQSQIVVSLPLGYPPGQLQGELRIYSNTSGGGKPINPKDVTLGFVLNTENLGKLSILLSIKEDNINGQLSVEKGELQEFLENHIGILREKLEALSYKVGNLAVKVSEVTVSPLVTKSVDLSSVTKIDIRV